MSHRKVAARAGVPLGSMTYHFSGRDELIYETFTRYANEVAARFYTTMQGAENRDEAVEIVAKMVAQEAGAGGSREAAEAADDLVLTHELYALAARDPKYREITHAWMAKSREAFELHFDPVTARLVDALVEGLVMHRALDVAGAGVGAGDARAGGGDSAGDYSALALEGFRRIVAL